MANTSSFEDLPDAGIEGINRQLTSTLEFGNEYVYGDFSQTLGEHLDIYSLDFPIFNGSNPRMWIKQCNHFFEIFPKISDVKRIDLAIWNFEGKAFSWILELPIDDVLAITWKQFCEVVCSRFDMLKISRDDDALVTEIEFEEESYPGAVEIEVEENHINSLQDSDGKVFEPNFIESITDTSKFDAQFELVSRIASDVTENDVLNFTIGGDIFYASFLTIETCLFEVKATAVATHLEGEKRNDDVGGIVVVKGLEELENVLTSWDPGDSIVGISSSLSEIIDALKVYEYSMHVHTGITGLLDNGRVKRACEFFREMPRRDATSLSVMVSGLIQNDYLDEARMLFLEYEEEGEGRNDTMISGYVYASDMESAMKLFFEMKSLMLSKGQGRSMWSKVGLNEIRPTLGIMSSRLPWIDTSPFGSSASQVNTKECSIISGSCFKMLEYIYLVPYSAPSCYYEIQEFIEILQLTLKGIVSSKSCYIDPQYYFDHLCGSEHAQWRVQQKFEDRGLPIELLSSLKQEGSEFLTNSKSTLALDELEILFKALLKSTCINKVVFYLSLARGLDYHTGDAVRKIWLKSCRERFVKMLSDKQLRETEENKATAHVTHSQLDDLIDFYHLKSRKGMSQLELEDEVQDDLKCITGECIYCNFTSIDPRGRGSSLGGGSVMAYVGMNYGGDDVKKERSMLVKNAHDELKTVGEKFLSFDPRGRGSHQRRGIVMDRRESTKLYIMAMVMEVAGGDEKKTWKKMTLGNTCLAFEYQRS